VHGRRGRLRLEAARRVGWRGRRPRSQTWASMPCRLEPEEGVRRCERERFGGEDQREGTGSPSHAGIDDGRRGYLQTPARNFASLVARSREGRRGNEEELGGYL
jgi:hypothetical protein